MRILLLLVAIGWHVGNFNFAASQLVSDRPKSLSDSLMTFTAKSFKTIAKNEKNNFIYSPYGAWTVLTMTSFGATGKTWQQMCSVLALPDDHWTTMQDVESMIDNFSTFTDYELRSAVKIFIDDNILIYSAFVHLTGLIFRSSPESVNFTNSDEAIGIINDWAAAQTNNRIKRIVDRETLDIDVSLLLVNAVHFTGSWAHQFPSQLTALMPFHVKEDTVIEVTTMRIYDDLEYGKLPNVQATFVKIPYKVTGGAVGVSMFVILPDEINGLEKLVENFEQDFFKLFGTNEKRSVHLHLPRFRIESTIDLKDSLVRMGSGDMFGTAAKFASITDKSSLKVSKVIQKAYIDVDQAGSEAAAVELRSPLVKEVKQKTVKFAVDRPFVCVIATDNRIPLFTAIITEPDSTPF